MGRFSGKSCRLITMIGLTAAFMLLEIIYGYITNSMALIADSFHMLSDVIALIIGFFCMKISKRTRCSRNTFGWVRAEVLGALVNTVFLIALSFSIMLEAIQRLFEYQYIRDPQNVLIVGGAGLLVNIIGLILFHNHGTHGHSHGGHGHNNPAPVYDITQDDNNHSTGSSEASKNSSNATLSAQSSQEDSSIDSTTSVKKLVPPSTSQQMNMRGVWLHILGDFFGSIVVIINALVNWFADVEFLRRYLDPLLSLVIAGIIICTSIPLLKESAFILMQTVPPHLDVSNIERKLLAQFGNRIASVHEFHIWRLTGSKIVATLHIRCERSDVNTYMQLAEKLKEFFHDEGIHSTTIQMELVQENTNIDQCILKCPKKIGDNQQSPCDVDVCCITPATPILTIVPKVDTKPPMINSNFISPKNESEMIWSHI